MSPDQPLTKAADVRRLPKIAMLNLIEENLPVSVGLLKLGSEAYMIGGKRVLAEDLKSDKGFGSECVKGVASRAAYRLSRAENGTTLSHSKCKKLKLKTPKFCPIVAEIGENIHVFDCAPSGRWNDSVALDGGWVFSHEVLKKDDGCWRKIPKTGVAVVGGIIKSHIVVGNCIYAVADGMFLVFNSETEKWEKKEPAGPVYWRQMDAFNAENVWDIINGIGIIRCAGEFILEEPAISERVYMLIGIVRSLERNYRDCNAGTHAIAYLVTSTGKVVCKQRLTDFFQGPMKPIDFYAGTMFDVDKERKTMCSIVYGQAVDKGKLVSNYGRDYLFINTFSVEQLGGAAKELKDLITGYTSGALCDRKFVEVVVRSSYVHGPDAPGGAVRYQDDVLTKKRYQGDEDHHDDDKIKDEDKYLIRFVDMQACCF